ncbi:MAG: Hsp20/alpha crystallin family protein [Anaerolineales bacterium]|nr:Hsp20/alpha crystallin family protein [Anaerolineales bacterium]
MMTMYVSPYRRLASLREAMDRALQESLTEKAPSEREMPLAIDVIADAEAFTIQAFVPGLDAEDLSIEILNNTLSIRGEFKNTTDGEAKFMTCELPYGRFSRVVSFPIDVDASKAEASIKNGILSLRIPKAESLRPKAIKVNIN